MNKAITILIADDHKHMRETLNYLIGQTDGLKVVGLASNGQEAINLTSELCPDIILLDINMTPINGFEAARKILKQHPDAKIIGLSLHQQPSYARNMLQIGAKGYLTKSSPHKEILHGIVAVANGEEYICQELKGLI